MSGGKKRAIQRLRSQTSTHFMSLVGIWKYINVFGGHSLLRGLLSPSFPYKNFFTKIFWLGQCVRTRVFEYHHPRKSVTRINLKYSSVRVSVWISCPPSLKWPKGAIWCCQWCSFPLNRLKRHPPRLHLSSSKFDPRRAIRNSSS